MNYKRIAKAIEFYKSLDYRWVDTPWIVSPEVTAITSNSLLERCHLGDLVGSAEQGFLQLILEGKLPEGRYVSAGPCFRFNDLGQPLKHPYFFKVELIEIEPSDYHQLLVDARMFMGGDKRYIGDTCDLEICGIEIGSYGIRTHAGYTWAYGTGLAEPRYSEALSAL